MTASNNNKTAVVLCSGGLDSTTLACQVAAEGYRLKLLGFDYGQRHVKELDSALFFADRLGATFDVIDLTQLNGLLPGSSLTTADVEVPDGHYAEETMRITVVPNRNAMMLAIAFGVAAAHGAEFVGTAVHAGDHYIYPDCRPSFIDAFRAMERLSLEGMWKVGLKAPFVNMTKGAIVRLGAKLGVPYAETWSCYKGGDIHCGSCGTCFERREAFAEAEVDDPTVYLATPDYADPRK